MQNSKITGTGSYLPPRLVTNHELEEKLNTTDQWIREKIGINTRHYVGLEMTTSDLATEAAKRALQAANKNPTDVDCIVVATATPDYPAPGVGVLVQKKLGCRQVPAFDVHNTSPGFIFSLEMADSLIRAQKYQCVLVIAAEVHSKILDFTEQGRMMSVIFGDGAGAVVLEPAESDSGILAIKLHSDGTHYNKLWCEKDHPTMDGRFVFENAVKLMSQVSAEVLENVGLTVKDINHVLPHQANLRIIEAIGKSLEVPIEKIHHNIEHVGNTSAASIPILLDQVVRAGKIKKGDSLLLMSFGSGFSWGAGVVRW